MCLTNLSTLYDKVTCSVNSRRVVDTVYLDFSKVFDTTADMLWPRKVVCVMNGELTGHIHRVVVDSSFSTWQLVRSGVP